MILKQSNVTQRPAPLGKIYQPHPAKARIIQHVRTAAVGDIEALHRVVIPGDSNDVSIHSGIDHTVGGFHDAPNPGELLCAALAACQDATQRMVAAVLGVKLEDLELEIDVNGAIHVPAASGDWPR